MKIKSKGLKLVVVGPKQTNKYDLVRGVMFLGYVPQIDLPVLYSGAEALVYPSLYEGFGLPILQAFATKTPVVTSNVGALAETGDKAVISVDPNSTSSISEGITKAMARKISLTRMGLERVKDFSWTRTAKETLTVYNELNK